MSKKMFAVSIGRLEKALHGSMTYIDLKIAELDLAVELEKEEKDEETKEYIRRFARILYERIQGAAEGQLYEAKRRDENVDSAELIAGLIDKKIRRIENEAEWLIEHEFE